MALDAPTLLTLTMTIAAAVAVYLASEWRLVRDRALLYWCAGFASITMGSGLSLLRVLGASFVGIWVANGLLVAAHLFFLFGVASFAGARLPLRWCAVALPWTALLLLPEGRMATLAYGLLNSGLVAALCFRAAELLRPRDGVVDVASEQLRLVLLGHGLFYLVKTMLVFAPGAFVDPAAFRGLLIPASLLEGVMVEVLIALSMTGTVRRRRETQIVQLAERDPLTGLFNRRAFDQRAAAMLESTSAHRPAALLLIDVDRFKQVNDQHGHGAGDRLLVLLGDMLRTSVAEHALAARLGGDEFAILLGDTGRDAAVAAADTLRSRFAAKTDVATLSIGAALVDCPATIGDMIDRADIALYAAKHGGRDRLHLTPAAAPQKLRAAA